MWRSYKHLLDHGNRLRGAWKRGVSGKYTGTSCRLAVGRSQSVGCPVIRPVAIGARRRAIQARLATQVPATVRMAAPHSRETARMGGGLTLSRRRRGVTIPFIIRAWARRAHRQSCRRSACSQLVRSRPPDQRECPRRIQGRRRAVLYLDHPGSD